MSDGPAVDDLRTPLAHFRGARPPAPTWFTRAIENAPERRLIEVDGARIETLVWSGPPPGEPSLPGLLFIHGGWAHADWWSFIAPFFTGERPCAALSLSGMGGSDRRARYGYDAYMAWTFDPGLWERLNHDDRVGSQEAELAAARCPMAIVAGDRSLIVDAEILAYTRAHAPPATPVVVVPDSGHHIMLDQPLALVALLRTLIQPGLWARPA